METTYETKVMKPSVTEARQVVENVAPVKPREFPEGWEYFVKRGEHCARNPEGLMKKFGTKSQALDWAYNV